MDLIGSSHSFENKAFASNQQKTKVEQVFDGHKCEPSCICIAVFKPVVLLKARKHDKSVGDYSEYFTMYIYCPYIAQLSSYFIRLHNRDFPD